MGAAEGGAQHAGGVRHVRQLRTVVRQRVHAHRAPHHQRILQHPTKASVSWAWQYRLCEEYSSPSRTNKAPSSDLTALRCSTDARHSKQWMQATLLAASAPQLPPVGEADYRVSRAPCCRRGGS